MARPKKSVLLILGTILSTYGRRNREPRVTVEGDVLSLIEAVLRPFEYSYDLAQAGLSHNLDNSYRLEEGFDARENGLGRSSYFSL